MGDTGGIRHQPQTTYRSNEHEQRHGQQHVGDNSLPPLTYQLILTPVYLFMWQNI